MKIALLFDHFGPYHLARLRGAGNRAFGIEFHGGSRDYAWERADRQELQVETLVNADAAPNALQEALMATLDQHCPNVVAVPGWSSCEALTALKWCLAHRVPAILMSESSAHDEVRSPWKEGIKRRLVGLFSSALAGGSAHADYLRELGMSANRIFLGYDAVDNAHFQRKPESKPDDPPFFLASARFIPKKNLPNLLRAYARYRELATDPHVLATSATQPTANHQPHSLPLSQSPPLPVSPVWNLVLLGDGELRPELEALIQELGLNSPVSGFKPQASSPPPTADCQPPTTLSSTLNPQSTSGNLPAPPVLANAAKLPTANCQPPSTSAPPPTAHCQLPTVYLPGFKQYDELPSWYHRASAFVHVSTTEQWGLVVNEAMAAGLPVLVSKRCGCAPDLVQEGVNGFTFDPFDVEAMAQAMLQLASLPSQRREKMGQASGRIIADWGPERFGEGLRQAAAKALETGSPRATLVDRLLLTALCRR